MTEEYSRCPVCYSQIVVDPEEIERLREEGIYVWTEDPLLTLRGLAGEEYKGKTPCRWLHTKQLQEARKQQEIDVGLEEEPEEPEEDKIYRTEFSEIKKGEPIRRIHIEELRLSTEKILEAMGITKDEYFNYDEEGNEMRAEHQTEWVESNLTLSTPVRAIHIEDLRHPVPLMLSFLFLSNQWTEGYGQRERHLAKYASSKEDDIPSLRLTKSVFSYPISGPVTLDNIHLYGISTRFITGIHKWGYSWHRSCRVRKVELSDLSGAGGGYVRIPTPSMWTADDSYIYSASAYWSSAIQNWKLALLKLTKYYGFVAITDAPAYGIIDATNDKEYIYVMSKNNFYIDKRTKDLNLVSSNVIGEDSEEQIGTNPDDEPLYEWKYWRPQTLCMDDKYLYCQVVYVRQKQWIEWYLGNWYQWMEQETVFYFYKLDKNFNTIWRKQLGRVYYNNSRFTPISEIDVTYAGELKFRVDRNYLYMLGQSYEIDTGNIGRIYIFDKETFSLLNTIENWKNDIRIDRRGALCCSDEYRFSQIEKKEEE